MGEEILFVDEVPAGERYRYREFGLDELASANESTTRVERISNNQNFEDPASYRGSGDDLYDLDRILGKKQDG
jgi:hypothetical protein